ncbi:hypothetical protein GOV12_02865 [Candidatus Pacearchaeota archaeon]|nr:hypothetical protein [Candidatus Pacearchaeota archaeon]
MVSRTYCKFVEYADPSEDSRFHQKHVHRRIDDIVEPSCMSQGGCRMRDDDIQDEVMTLYRGMVDVHKRGVNQFSVAEDLRYLAEEIQLLTLTDDRSHNLNIAYTKFKPKEDFEDEVEKRMQELGYERFVLDETYVEILGAKSITFDKVFENDYNFSELLVLLG